MAGLERVPRTSLGEGMSESDIMRGRLPGGGREPQRAEKRAGLMEVCLLSLQCLQRHRPSACDKFKGLSLQHRRSVITAKELCVPCLRHSDLDAVKVSKCIRKDTPPHWVRQ
jgi:hypothetical protein